MQMIAAYAAVEIVRQRLTHGGACFCMAQWAYSNHPADASYSSSLSRCSLPKPVFLFFTHGSGCRSPNLHFYCSAPPVGRRRRRQCALAGMERKNAILLVILVFTLLSLGWSRTTAPPPPPHFPPILVACQLAETDGLAQLRCCQAAELKTEAG